MNKTKVLSEAGNVSGSITMAIQCTEELLAFVDEDHPFYQMIMDANNKLLDAIEPIDEIIMEIEDEDED